MEQPNAQKISFVENDAVRSVKVNPSDIIIASSKPAGGTEAVSFGQLADTSNPSDSKGIMTMAITYGKDKVFFAGVANAELFGTTYDYFTKSLNLLLEAVNNRTRERNYFKLYAENLMGEVSDEDFERELEEHEDLYVVRPYREATRRDLYISSYLAEHGELMDVHSVDDIAELFSFKYQSVRKELEALQG